MPTEVPAKGEKCRRYVFYADKTCLVRICESLRTVTDIFGGGLSVLYHNV